MVRAHLVRQYTAQYGLRLLDPHLAYLTGPAIPPGIRGFRILDRAPYAERTVAGWARRDRSAPWKSSSAAPRSCLTNSANGCDPR